MLARRTYAVNDNPIECEFFVNDSPMGSILKNDGNIRKISYHVKGFYPMDKVVIYKNLKPIHIVESLLMEPSVQDSHYCFSIEMGWGDNQEDLFGWKGAVSIKNGLLVKTVPCWHGRSVLAPSSTNTDGNDSINAINDRITQKTENHVAWQCFTVKNIFPLHPQTNAVIFEVEGIADTEVTISVNGHTKTLTVAQLMQYGYSEHMKPYHSQTFKVHPIISENQYTVSNTFTDTPTNQNDFYHMEVTQRNGSCAFVSPVF